MRSRFQEMNQHMQDQMNQQAGKGNFPNNPQAKKADSRLASEEYIEFEEVK